MTKAEKMQCKQMATTFRPLFEKIIDELKRQINEQKTVKATAFETAAAAIDAEGQIKGMYKLYCFIQDNAD